MIRLNKVEDSQDFALTCSELTTLTNPFYLFVFRNDMSGVEKVIVLADKSERKGRYNLFTIDGSFFDSEGWYTYKVYEQNTADNILIANTVSVVEEGRAFIYQSNPTEPTEYNNEVKFKEYDASEPA